MSRYQRPRASTLLACVVLSAVFLGGCSKVRSLLGLDEGAGGASASASSTASAARARSAAGGVCKVVSHKMWGTGVNARTGITVTRLSGGRFAIGVAMGDRPEVIAFDRAGEGRIVEPPIAAGSLLAHGVSAARGRRDLQRVTPAVGAGGALVAYADYRDVYKNERRRVACGRTDRSHELLVFDGKPLLGRADEDKTDKSHGRVAHAGEIPPAASVGKVAAATARPIAVVPRGLLGRVHVIRPELKAAPKPRPAAPVQRGKPERELRGCRSFVDPAGHDAWAVGSQLYGKPQSDGSTQWSMRFFVAPGAGRAHVLLRSEKLSGNPDKLYMFEAPVAEKLPDGRYVLTTRYRNSLLAWTLDLDKRPRGPARRYAGGYPTLPHMLRDGDDLLILFSQKTEGDRWAARLARVSGRGGMLPKSLDPLAIDSDPSQTEPSFAKVGGQRWIAYQAGRRRHGQLVIVPLDDKLAAAGLPFRVTSPDQSVYESDLFSIGTGKLLVVYIENSRPALLVSEVLDCHVET